ncbi:MAG TPA: GH92 family glycosyl hydrolase [Candidatus Acidoferrales bacterium]|nr:GH92 family glycosyl hydrolase [Candidatus Acidoferrales bacterium]
MKTSRSCLLLLSGCLVAAFSQAIPAGESPLELANPLVGTAALDKPEFIGNAPPPGEEIYTGFVWPGPALPHRDFWMNPINKDLNLASGNHGIIFPYIWQRKTMIGFSSRVPGLTLMPLVGDWTTPPDRCYASAYAKDSEKASPGYYSVYFPDYQVHVELTTSEEVQYYRFTFPATERATVLLDLGPRNAEVHIDGDRKVTGRSEGRHFVAEFSKACKAFGSFHQNLPAVDRGRIRRDDVVNPGSRADNGSYAGCYLNFATKAGEQVVVRVATDRTEAAAQEKLDQENPAVGFDGVKKQAEEAWSQKLNLVQVEGGTEHERQLFYSTLYHSFASPRLVAKAGEFFRGADGNNYTGDYDRYSAVPFWDTGRDQIVLLMMLEPDVVTNIMRSHLEMARETGWMHTDFHGDNAVFLYLGAWERGIPFDWGSVYPFLRKNATDPAGPRGYLAEYLQKGWIHDTVVASPSPPYADGSAGVATTLEYSWDDYALALFAKKLGHEDDYQMFLARAHSYTNMFDASIGFMRGRNADGSWISPFDPQEPYYNFMMKEASGWQTLWIVPHDVQGLIGLLGGREKFCAKLDQFFSLPYHPTGIARDVTGMLGQYCQGNQPDRATPFFYDYAGQPWKTQAIVRRILADLYGSDKAGLAYPGMDDQGSTSSWYVMGALGFFAPNPAQPEYAIASPLFDRATIHLRNGKDFVITAKNNSATNIYIQSATLNGTPLNKPWFSHGDIVNGGSLEFVMGPQPNQDWGSAPDAAPPSMTR